MIPSAPSGAAPGDGSVSRWLLTIRDFLRALRSAPFVWSRSVPVVFPSATTVRVVHGLGSPVTGWTVTRRSANAQLWEAGTHSDSQSIDITSSAAVTVTIAFH